MDKLDSLIALFEIIDGLDDGDLAQVELRIAIRHRVGQKPKCDHDHGGAGICVKCGHNAYQGGL